MNANNIIQIAAGKGRTIWLQRLLTELSPQLNQPETDHQTWFDSLIEVMEHRGLTQPTQQKDYLSFYRINHRFDCIEYGWKKLQLNIVRLL